MRPLRFLAYSSALTATTLLLIGCGDETTNNETSVREPTFFAADPGALGLNAWKVPRFGLTLHGENRTDAWTVAEAVATDARPGGYTHGRLGSGTITKRTEGSRSYQLQNFYPQDFPQSVVREEVTAFLDGLSLSTGRYLALGADSAVYSFNSYYSNQWQIYLPTSTAAGVAWHTDLVPRSTVGKVFAYRELGEVAYRPKIRSAEGTLPAEADPLINARMVAVDVEGDETDDSDQVAIDYTFANGYQGEWIFVTRIPHCTVTATGVSTPDDGFDGCIRVSVTFSYQLSTPATVGYDHLLGMDEFDGGYTLFWKPGTGWVYWTGSETSPRWGFGSLSTLNSAGQPVDYDLSNYNMNYDAGTFGSADIGESYQHAWHSGFQAAYRDSSSPYSWEDRKTLPVSFAAYLEGIGVTQSELLAGNPGMVARKAVSDPAFSDGYALGLAYYTEDFIELTEDWDILLPDQSRSDQTLDGNLVPNEFRPNGALFLDNLARMDLLDGAPVTGVTYAHGYDGLGSTADIYDSTATGGIDGLRVRTDAEGRELRNIYISLPVMGTITTRSHQGATTGTVIANGGNG